MVSWIPVMPIVTFRKCQTQTLPLGFQILCDVGLKANCRGEGYVTVSGFQILLSWPTSQGHEITRNPALWTVRLIARNMLYVKFVSLCFRNLHNLSVNLAGKD